MRHLKSLLPLWFAWSCGDLRELSVSCLCFLSIMGMAAGQPARRQEQAQIQLPLQGISEPQVSAKPQSGTPAAKSQEKVTAIMLATPFPSPDLSFTFIMIASRACAAELRTVRGLDVTEERDQSRNDAINAAKEDAHGVVVYLEFRAFALSQGPPKEEDLTLYFTIFEPKTGKVMTTGAGYPTSLSYQLPKPPSGAARDERLVESAARDAARKILKKLNLKVQP